MKTIAYLLSVLAVIGMAYWAYHENYATQDAMDQSRKVARQIAAAHERLSILNDEWAYQNRPDRLRDLVLANFDALGLVPMSPDSFGSVEQVAFPPEPEPALPQQGFNDPIAVGSDGLVEDPL